MSGLLVLAETDGKRILPRSLATLRFAQEYAEATQTRFSILAVGGEGIAESTVPYLEYGAERMAVVASPKWTNPTADCMAMVCEFAMQRLGCLSLAGLASSFGRDVLPRVAARKGLPMLSDVLSIEPTENGLNFKRPMYAGNILATVRIRGESGVFSVRGTAFGKPTVTPTQSPIETLDVDELNFPDSTRWLGLETEERSRPDLTTASVVVSGGRPLGDAETFERLVGGLADKLGGAVGATRAAVDSGIAPNELQVGQTGKMVAPQLYIAAGISGSIQHLAGMKDSGVIVAINTDSNAPIFEVADLGYVGDLHKVLPLLIEKL